MTARLGLTGDVMLGRLVDEHQRSRSVEAVWGEVFETLHSLDGLVVNLECCLSTRGSPWQRTQRPFQFRADPSWALRSLTSAGVDVCSLANNHVLDFEVPALIDTLDHLDDAGIGHTGAGRTIDQALEPARFCADSLTVAVIAFTDNTPEYAAAPDRPGVAYIEIDVDDGMTNVRVRTAFRQAIDTEPDVVIASLHWGPNMITTVPESFQRFAHWLVDLGVDIVHGHSAHVFRGVEVIDGSLVLYDTGDFVDDYAVDPELRNDRSFLYEVRIDADGSIDELVMHPVEIDDFAVHHVDRTETGWWAARLRERSATFDTEIVETDGVFRVDIDGDETINQPPANR